MPTGSSAAPGSPVITPDPVSFLRVFPSIMLPMFLAAVDQTIVATALPAIAAFYAGATLWSALQYRLGRGGRWKGRVQDARAAG